MTPLPVTSKSFSKKGLTTPQLRCSSLANVILGFLILSVLLFLLGR